MQPTDQSKLLPKFIFLSFSCEMKSEYSTYKRMVEPWRFPREPMQISELLCIYIECETTWREMHLLNRFL